MQLKLDKPPESPPDDALVAVQIFNQLKKCRWLDLPTLCALHGVNDIEHLIHQLIEIQDYANELN